MVAELRDVLVSIHYKIPLVYREKVENVGISATPDKEIKFWEVRVISPFRVLFVVLSKDKLFFGEEAMEVLPNLYETRLVNTGPSCIREIVRRNRQLTGWCFLKEWITDTYIV